MGGTYSTHEKDKKCIHFGRKTSREEELGRTMRRQEYYIRMELKKLG
jgi:hypothetical protein